MRELFILLLLVNLVILGWGIFKNLQNPPRNDPPIEKKGDLRMLSEQDADITGTVASEAVLENLEKESLPTQTAAGPKIEQAPLSEVAPEKKKKVSDSRAESLDKAVSSVNNTSPRPYPVAACGALGPMEKGSLARTIASNLERQGIDTSLRRERYTKNLSYMVIIPPVDSQAEAIQLVRDLKANGIGDINRFVRGEIRNGISLGVFKKEENAKSRMREIEGKGFNTEIVPRTASIPFYWVDFRALGKSHERPIESILKENSKLKMIKRPCPHIVTR